SGWQKLVADGAGHSLAPPLSVRLESWQDEMVTVGIVPMPPVQLTTDSVRSVLLQTLSVPRVPGLKPRVGLMPRTPISFGSTPSNWKKSKNSTPLSAGASDPPNVMGAARVAPPSTQACVWQGGAASLTHSAHGVAAPAMSIMAFSRMLASAFSVAKAP